MYEIARINLEGEFDKANLFHIEHHLWGSTYQPEVTGRLAYMDGGAFMLQMVCREANPTRVYTNNDDPVCRDSCMEAFLDFKPADTSLGYVSFEMNANGALHSSFGTCRYDRVFLQDMGIKLPQPTATVCPGHWQVDLTIPLELVTRLYGKLDFIKGYKMKGNFYKCGDDTPTEHYSSWSMVSSEKPDFHLSQYFGEIIMG